MFTICLIYGMIYIKIKSNSKSKIKTQNKGGGVNESIQRSQTSKK